MQEPYLRDYAYGTYTVQGGAWSQFIDGKALCSDGEVRRLRFYDGIADTFFSVPCSVSVKGKTVSGYMTIETKDGLSTPTYDDPLVVKFVAYKYGKNGGLLP